MSLQTSCLQPLSLIQYPSICPLIFLYSSDVTSKFSLPTREKCCESSHGMNYSKACFILHCIEMTRNKNNFKMFKKNPLEGYLAYWCVKFNEKNTVHRVFLINASCISVQRQGLKWCSHCPWGIKLLLQSGMYFPLTHTEEKAWETSKADEWTFMKNTLKINKLSE